MRNLQHLIIKKIDFDLDKFIKAYVKKNYGGDLILDSKVQSLRDLSPLQIKQ